MWGLTGHLPSFPLVLGKPPQEDEDKSKPGFHQEQAVPSEAGEIQLPSSSLLPSPPCLL